MAVYAVTERKVLDSVDVAKILGAFAGAMTVGTGLMYRAFRRVKTDKSSDTARADQQRTDEATSAMQRRALDVVEKGLKQSQEFAERMERVAQDAQSAAHRDRRLRQIAEARLARVQKQAADDREADRREVERLMRRITELENIVRAGNDA